MRSLKIRRKRVYVKGIEWYWNYGNYSTLPTFINQGIYDNRRIFVEIPRYVSVPIKRVFF